MNLRFFMRFVGFVGFFGIYGMSLGFLGFFRDLWDFFEKCTRIFWV